MLDVCAELHEQPRLLGEREEVARVEQAAVGVQPPRQDLVAEDATGRQVHDRLEVRDHLVALDPATQLGPLANSRRIDAMEDFVADAKSKGARVLAGGQRIGNSGYFFPLTVLADVPDDARAMRDEPFGPLALINPVRDLDEAIEKANSLPYGLAAYAFTRSAQNADRLASEVEVGNLSINHFVASVAETPFGGVKESGYGREGGTEGLQCYTVTKNVSHKMI